MDSNFDVNVLEFVVAHIYDINSKISGTPIYNWNEDNGDLSVDDIRRSSFAVVRAVSLMGNLVNSLNMIKKYNELNNDK